MTARISLTVLLASAATVTAAPVPKWIKAKGASKIDTARFKVMYDNTPFARVIEDFAEGSGLKFVGELPPLGALTLKPNREYTGVAHLDLLNEALSYNKFMLTRHGNTFYLHPTDRPVDREQVDTVTADELKARGRTEVVRHVLQLPDGLKAKDVRPQVEKTLSPAGVVEDGKSDGELVVTDRAANVRVALAVCTEKPVK
jgi:hypothetical protein